VFVCCYLHLDRWEFQEGFFTCSVCILSKKEGKMTGEWNLRLVTCWVFLVADEEPEA
jgi:hypothetical protein